MASLLVPVGCELPVLSNQLMQTRVSHYLFVLWNAFFLISRLGKQKLKVVEYILKICQNTANYFYFVDVSVSIRNLHQKKKLVLVLLVLDKTRTWHAKKAVVFVCVTELIAAFIAIHGFWTLRADVYRLFDHPGKTTCVVVSRTGRTSTSFFFWWRSLIKDWNVNM